MMYVKKISVSQKTFYHILRLCSQLFAKTREATRYCMKGKGKGAHEPKAQTAGAYSGVISLKHLGVLLLSPGHTTGGVTLRWTSIPSRGE